MPQLLNMLAASPKASQASNGNKGVHSSENNGFSDMFKDEKSKVEVSSKLDDSHKSRSEKELDSASLKENSKTDKADASLIFRQIKMGEELEKGQNIAADGQELPSTSDEQSLLDEGDASLDDAIINGGLFEDQTIKDSNKLSDGIWPVMTNITGEGADSKNLEEDAEKMLTSDESELLNSEGIPASVSGAINGSLNLANESGVTNSQDKVTAEQLLAEKKLSAQPQLSKASFVVASESDMDKPLTEIAAGDKKVNNLSAIANGDIASSDKSLLTKDQMLKSTGSEVNSIVDKLGLKNTGEASEKVANFQVQQLARESDLSAGIGKSSRDSGISDILGQTTSLSSSQLATQTQQVQLSLRQGGDQPVQMKEMIQRFNPVMKQQLVAMVKNGIQQAEIRLDPPELGSMVVRIQVQGDQTQVQFQAAQSQTRELLEQALPKLRDMLSDQGMELTDGQVSQENNSQENESRENFEGNESAIAYDMNEISAEDLPLGTNQATSYTSGIDYYA